MSQQYEGHKDSAKWEKAKAETALDDASAQHDEDQTKTAEWEHDKNEWQQDKE